MIKEDIIFGSILVAATTVPPVSEENKTVYIGIFLAVFFGIMLKIGIDLKKQTFSFKGLLVQLLITFPVCWGAYNVWIWRELTMQLQTYMFIISTSAVVIAMLLDKLIQFGWNAAYDFLISYLKNKLEKKEDKP